MTAIGSCDIDESTAGGAEAVSQAGVKTSAEPCTGYARVSSHRRDPLASCPYDGSGVRIARSRSSAVRSSQSARSSPYRSSSPR